MNRLHFQPTEKLDFLRPFRLETWMFILLKLGPDLTTEIPQGIQDIANFGWLNYEDLMLTNREASGNPVF